MKTAGKFDAAYDAFNHCLAIDSTASAVLYELSSFYAQLNRPEKSLEMLRRAVAYSSDNFTYRLALATMSRNLGMFGEAAEEYEKLVKDYPGKPELNYYLADALTQEGEIGKAIDAYDALESSIGMNEALSMQKYKLYNALEQTENAFKEVEKLADKFPMESRYQIILGDLHLEKNDTVKALKYYQKAHEIDPGSPYYIVSMANYYEAVGNKDAAETQIRNALVNEKLDVDTKVGILSRYILKLQQTKKGTESANALFLTLLEQHPEDIDLKQMYGSLLITQGKNFVEGIENVYDRIKGSCSMLLLTEDGIIVARDKWGRTPIIIGKKDGAYAATSESSSLPNLDYEIDRFVGPGEILRLRADSIEQMRQPNEQMQVCSFLWVYYGFPVSCYEGRNVEEVRFQSGYKMGKKDESEVDCVCGIPDSGVGMALGYAEGKGAPYHRAIAKYTPTWPRSFTPANQELRSLVAKMKLIPNRAMLEGKRILFCDDSIVRGTQLRDNVNILYDYGAKEVHMRIACPPLIYGCPFLGFTSSKSPLELITRRIIKELEGDENKNLEKYATTDSPEYQKMVQIIAERFGLSSLKFNTLETLIEAIGLPKCKVCTHCFDGSSCF